MKKTWNLTKTIFLIYCGILIWTVLLKMAASPEELRFLTGVRKLNLIPFDYRGGVPRILIRETAMNVLVFIPFGFYLNMLGVSGGKAVFRGLFLSFAFECCQYLLAIGISDMTDLLTNTMGTAIGVGLYLLIREIWPDKDTADRRINRVAAVALLLFGALLTLLILAN